MNRRISWLALNAVFHGSPRPAWRILRSGRTPEDILGASEKGLRSLGLTPEAAGDIASGEPLRAARTELERAEKKGFIFLTPDDETYPSLLREIYDPPLALYVAGHVDVLAGPAVALVGSRRVTPYGRAVAERLAADLAERGLVVISGLARGADTAAHRGALEKGKTAAVLGSGLERIYPRENRGLFEAAAATGAVVSEFMLDAGPLSYHFPLRNRIISGLALGVVVIEASERSGSLITARLALDQGREVMAVPGNITSPLSRGAHGLVKAGARLVESWEDVIEELPLETKSALLAGTRREQESTCLDGEESLIMGSLVADGTVHVDEILDRTGLSVPVLLSALLKLELKRLVIQHPGKRYQRRL